MPKMIEITAAEYERLQDCIREDGMRIAALIEENKALHQDAKHLTAVDAAPMTHAKWLLRHVGHGHYWECSHCHQNPCIYVTEDTKFCPNCGAKMNGEGGGRMTETPKCPYCGAELEVTHAFVNDATAAHKLVYTCFCRDCGVYTPKRSTPEEALFAALHRAEPEIRPLTLEEIIAELENKELDVMWVECTVLMAAVPMCPSHRHGDTAFFFAPLMIQACTETLSNYGKTWRCWPRKPTREQMAAEKWEE